MTEPDTCDHPSLASFETVWGPRGWRCGDCGASGPTAVSCEPGYSKHGPTLMVRMLCVCGAGWEWPMIAAGDELAGKLTEHADCKPGGDGG